MYNVKALRPKNSKMNKEKLINNKFNKLINWKEAVKEYINS